MIERKYDEASRPNARRYTVFAWKEFVKPQNIDNTAPKNFLGALVLGLFLGLFGALIQKMTLDRPHQL